MSPSDLSLTAAELTAFTTRLASAANTDPVQSVINSAVGRVALYTNGRPVAAADTTRLAAALALHELHVLVNKGEVPAGIKARYDAAMTELEAIRDGKFKFDGQASAAGAIGARPRPQFGNYDE